MPWPLESTRSLFSISTAASGCRRPLSLVVVRPARVRPQSSTWVLPWCLSRPGLPRLRLVVLVCLRCQTLSVLSWRRPQQRQRHPFTQRRRWPDHSRLAPTRVANPSATTTKPPSFLSPFGRVEILNMLRSGFFGALARNGRSLCYARVPYMYPTPALLLHARVERCRELWNAVSCAATDDTSARRAPTQTTLCRPWCAWTSPTSSSFLISR